MQLCFYFVEVWWWERGGGVEPVRNVSSFLIQDSSLTQLCSGAMARRKVLRSHNANVLLVASEDETVRRPLPAPYTSGGDLSESGRPAGATWPTEVLRRTYKGEMTREGTSPSRLLSHLTQP